MKKIGFIGIYDKIDLILSLAKLFVETKKKVLIIDSTTNQKAKYVVPVINPTKSYITEFNGIDVAVGFNSFGEIKKYLGIEEEEKNEYDIIMIDVDNYQGMLDFEVQTSDKIYYVTSFDAYSLKKGIELLKKIETPIHMTKVFFSKEMLKEEVEYFEYLALGVKVLWNEEKIYFLLENGDQAVLIENQRIEKIKFKRLSTEYKDNIIYMVNDMDSTIDDKTLKSIMKNL